MQIQVRTDNHIRGSAELDQLVQNAVEGALDRFGSRVTRVEVHFTDENSRAKAGDDDKRCAMEARLAGLQPIAVTNQGATLQQALDGAAEKLLTAVERAIDRQDDPKGRTSFAGDQTV
jgi:ribosome-associated translation inhibitor RaiA